MFEEPPIYYILISLIFLIVFGAVAFATWLPFMCNHSHSLHNLGGVIC